MTTWPFFLIYAFLGNKIDREDREIPTEVGEEFSQRHGMYFIETSAKASDNVERLFTEIAQDLLQVSFIYLAMGETPILTIFDAF